MPVPSSITDLSTTVASNSPAGSETPTDGDNYLRTFASFIALLRDGGAITGKLTGIPLGTAALPSYSFTGDVDTGMWSPAANTLAWSLGGTEYLRLTSDGRIYGTALHNNAGAVTGTTNQYIASGTYTPTLTNSTNITASTAKVCNWTRVGNIVHVAGQVDIDPTSASNSTLLGMTLPIASNFTNASQLSGTAVRVDVAGVCVAGFVFGDITNDRASLEFTCDGTAVNLTWYFTYSYEVL